MSIIGFTGTRRGMTSAQRRIVSEYVREHLNQIEEVHHGDCVGADTDFHDICQKLNIKIIVHPSTLTEYRAHNEGEIVCSEKRPLERNRDIVRNSDVLIATPKENSEVRRSGTWATIRYAKEAEIKRRIVWPEGNVLFDRGQELLTEKEWEEYFEVYNAIPVWEISDDEMKVLDRMTDKGLLIRYANSYELTEEAIKRELRGGI